MKLNFRTYQKSQIKLLLLKNNFLFLTIGASQNSTNWTALEQNLHKLDFSYTKVYNNVTTKVFQASVAKKYNNTINSTVFFLTYKNNTKMIKSTLLNEISSSKFNIIALKLNKKFYTKSQLKKLNSFYYRKNVAILYQFLSTNQKVFVSVSS